MSWDSVMKKAGKGSVYLLKQDKEVLVFKSKGEPEAATREYKGQETDLYLVPVITEKGIGCLPMTSQTLRSFWSVFEKNRNAVFAITRHGAAKKIETYYSFAILEGENDAIENISKMYTPEECTEICRSGYEAFQARCDDDDDELE